MFIDELTWEETRDAIKAGKTTVIVPTGGTEKNGYHMVLGKHNFVVTHAANLMARRLKNALVAPTIQYVPEGDPDRAGPGVISLPSPAYDMLLDAAARSLQAHGFTDILFIGDSGGNQAGLTQRRQQAERGVEGRAASRCSRSPTTTKADASTTARGCEAAFGYDDTIVGSHAGISDTSQMLHVRPAGIRKDQIKPWGGPRIPACQRRSDEGDGRDRQDGHRVQSQRRARSVPDAEEPAERTRRPRLRRYGDDPRRLFAATMAVSSVLTTIAAAQAPNAPAPRLVKVKALECTSAVLATGTWTDGEPVASTKPASLAVSFTSIDTQEGTADAAGDSGKAHITVRLVGNYLTLMQMDAYGALYVTTVFNTETKNGRLQAVHTRHEYTPVQLPGITSRPEQYYGDCGVK